MTDMYLSSYLVITATDEDYDNIINAFDQEDEEGEPLLIRADTISREDDGLHLFYYDLFLPPHEFVGKLYAVAPSARFEAGWSRIPSSPKPDHFGGGMIGIDETGAWSTYAIEAPRVYEST